MDEIKNYEIQKASRIVIIFSYAKNLYTVLVEQFGKYKRPWEPEFNPNEIENEEIRFSTWKVGSEWNLKPFENKLSFIWWRLENWQSFEETAIREAKEEISIPSINEIKELSRLYGRPSGHNSNIILLNKFFLSNLWEIDKHTHFKPEKKFHNEIKRAVIVPFHRVTEFLKKPWDKHMREEFISPKLKLDLYWILSKS